MKSLTGLFVLLIASIGAMVLSVTPILAQGTNMVSQQAGWLDELLANIDIYPLIGYLIGVLGIGIITALWQTFKTGRESYKKYFEYKKGGWTQQEKNDYIDTTGAFWGSINSLWQAIIQGFRGLVKRRKK